MSCLLTWEREVVSLAAYLATIRDPIMVVVYKHLQLWMEKCSFSLLPSANKILQDAGSAAAFPENPPLSWKKVIRELQKAQEVQLVLKAAFKQHQGKFMSDMRRQAAHNETLSVQWLTKGRLRSTTEALILAAQDDCIYTRSFKANCMGNAGDTHCRQWDSLQVERRAEKLSKYGELCADLRRQFLGYRMDIVSVVIGVLGTITLHLVGDIGRRPTAAKTESQIEGLQRSVLCSSVRILRSHLSAPELAA